MEVKVLLCPPISSPHEFPVPTIALKRTVPKSASVADMTVRAMLNAVVQGDEYARAQSCPGVWSSADYRGVTVAGGVATVKMARPFAEIFQNDDSNEYAASYQRAISANLKQFPFVKTVRYVVEQ
jgi:hypothetical protein